MKLDDIGLYPPVRGNPAGPRGNLKFPYDKPLPLALIARIVRHKVKQDAAKARVRKKK